MNDSFLTPEVESLIQGYVEGDLSASESLRLRELLQASPTLIEPILVNLRGDALIRQTVMRTTGANLETLPDAGMTCTESTVLKAKWFRPLTIRFAAATFLVVLLVMGVMFFATHEPGRQGSNATLSTRTGSILYEYWINTSGSAITDLTSHPDFPDSPTGSEFLPDFETPRDRGQDYGARVRGYLHPQVSGNYRFWIAADDAGELWLSADENPADKKRICFLDTWAPPREWTWRASQQSRSIRLKAGRRYYIEALHKQGNAGDSFAVAWQPPGSALEIIPGRALSPFSQTNAASTSGQQKGIPERVRE